MKKEKHSAPNPRNHRAHGPHAAWSLVVMLTGLALLLMATPLSVLAQKLEGWDYIEIFCDPDLKEDPHALIGKERLPGAPKPPKVKIFLDKGVPEARRSLVQSGINGTLRFFKDNHQVSLRTDAFIVVAPDKAAFTNDMKRVCKMTEAEAKRLDHADGISCGDKAIAINIKGKSDKDILIFTAHELIHKYQHEQSNKTQNIAWLHEGAADAIATYVVQLAKAGSVEEQKKICWKVIRKNKKHMPLSKLHKYSAWQDASGKRYANYETAELAAYELARQAGFKALFNYFKYLRSYNNSVAFEKAFRISLSKFEQSFEKWLDKNR